MVQYVHRNFLVILGANREDRVFCGEISYYKRFKNHEQQAGRQGEQTGDKIEQGAKAEPRLQ